MDWTPTNHPAADHMAACQCADCLDYRARFPRQSAASRIAELEDIVRVKSAMLDQITAAAGYRVGEQFSAPEIIRRLRGSQLTMEDTMPLSELRHPFLGPTEDDWNLDLPMGDVDYGKPGVGVVAEAVSVWTCLQDKPVMLGDVAASFRMPVEAVVQCVDWHPWMYLIGDENTPLDQLVIEHEHEGE